MTTARGWDSLATVIAWAALTGSHTVFAQISADPSPSERVPHRVLPTLPQLDGSRPKVPVVEVVHGLGKSSPPRTHPCAVIGYVIQGALRMQVKGEADAISEAGESSYEGPNGAHLVSANAHDKEAANLIAYFVCEHDTPLSIAVLEPRAPGGK